MKRHLGKNVVIVAALVAAGFLVAWIRFSPYLGRESSFTDGEELYDPTGADEIRFAVWDLPEALPSSVNTEAWESRPAVSPDGRFLVFGVGRRGLNADLWIAELVDGVPVEPRPLVEVNSSADDLAPAFGPGHLYLASNRRGGQGGLDLWRASYLDGVFGLAENLGTGVNGEGNEADPAPIPGSRDLVFASDRASGRRSDWNLYVARPRPRIPGTPEPEEPDLRVSPLEALNTGFQEREPTFTADGRSVVFASDRDGTLGGFDLFRSMRKEGAWLPAEVVPGVNSIHSERGPKLSEDGFSLLMAIEDGRGGSDLFRARSLELFRMPGRPVGWLDLLILLALVLLALLAWLAKRWESLEVLYKCFLASVIAHLLMLWWFREIYPESEEVPLAGESRVFQVQLASASSSASARRMERGGVVDVERTTNEPEVAPARAESRASEARPTEATAQSVERAAGATGSTPVRESVAQDRSAPTEAQALGVAVAQPAAEEPRESTAAPGLALRAPTVEAVERQAAGASGELDRAEVAVGERTSVTPGERRNDRGSRSLQVPQGEAAPGSLPSRDEGAALAVAQGTPVALPSESFQTQGGAAPALDLDPLEGASAGRSESGSKGELERIHHGATGIEDARPEGVDAPGLMARRESEAEAAPEYGGSSAPESQPTDRDLGAVALEDLSDAASSAPSLPTTEAPDLDWGGTHVATALDRPTGPRGGLEPRRFERSRPERPSPEAGPRRLDPAAREEERPASDFESRVSSPDGRAGAPAVAMDLEDLEEPTEVGDPAISEASAEVAGLGETLAAKRFAPQRRTSGGPRRHQSELPGEVSQVRPTERALGVAAAPERRNDVATAERLEHTPYRSRFGERKQVAIETYGGSEETERAVAAGLRYLAGRQRRDGSWGDPRFVSDKYREVNVGKTGLALLAFLGAGHTPESNSEYSASTVAAMEFLLASQGRATGQFGNASSYSHGIATYALAECYALMEGRQREVLRRPLERAVQRIADEQIRGRDRARNGGWSYYYPDGSTFDSWPRVSITAWQVMALESARLGGLEVEDRIFEGARSFLLGSVDSRRGFMRYSHDPSRLNSNYPTLPGSTPAGLFGLSLLGEDISGNEYRELRGYMAERIPTRYRMRSEDAFVHEGSGNLYFWYYGSLAMLRAGGSEWRRWNEGMKDVLLGSQAEEGSWAPLDVYATRYAGDRDNDRVYSTSMCVLTLEVYYRYFTPLLKVR